MTMLFFLTWMLFWALLFNHKKTTQGWDHVLFQLIWNGLCFFVYMVDP